LVPFLGVHFGLFLDSDLLVLRDFFVREEDFWPFLDGFLTVHLSTILPPFTSVELWSVIEPWLAGRRLVQGPAWVYVAHIRRISTLLVLAFAINSRNLSRPLKVRLMPTSLFGDCTGSISMFASIYAASCF
jgi:hypothetical protein